MKNLRSLFLLDPSINFLNHGSFGATPKPVFHEYQRWQLKLEHQPVEFLIRDFAERMAVSRAVLADYLGTQRDNLVYVTNATVGVNIVARSLELGPNDEVLTTNHEYGACDRIWRFLANKNGFAYVNQAIPVPISAPDEFLEQLWQAVTPRTKVIYLSHITSSTAMTFPIADVCHRAQKQGILTVIDGAHVPGQLDLNLEEMGADFYIGNLHKWLCAPKGAAFLYTKPEKQELLEPLIVSWGYEAEKPGPSQFVDHHELWGTRDIAAFLSVPAAIEFQKEHDWDTVRVECHALAVQAEKRIRTLSGLPSLYPNDLGYTQMAAALLPDETDIADLKEYLYDGNRIEIPLLDWEGKKLIRISVQGYNSQKDVDSLINALEEYFNKIKLK